MHCYPRSARYALIVFCIPAILAWSLQAAAALPSGNSAFTWQTPAPHGDSIHKASFINALEGWAVGAFKGVLHTTDGGRTWARQPFGPHLGFVDICFVDQHHGWVVGQGSDAWDMDPLRAMIWHTQDGGQTWKMQLYDYDAKGIANGLGSVHFSDRLNGWAGGRATRLYQTRDGGQTWDRVTDLPLTESEQFLLDIVGMQFVTPAVGFMVAIHLGSPETSMQKLLYTTDGGATWQVAELPAYQAQEANGLFHVHFITAWQGWVAGRNGHVYMTADGGQTWQDQRLAFHDDVAALFFSDVLNGWILTRQPGRLLVTRNGGADWQPVVAQDMGLNVLVVSDNEPRLALGDIGFGLSSADGGETWEALSAGLWHPMRSITFTSEAKGWMVGDDGAAWATADGGETWLPLVRPMADDLRKVVFSTPESGWILGRRSLFHTADGGATWQIVALPELAAELLNICFVNPQTGWLTGRSGQILHTSDGGETWQRQAVDSDGEIGDLHFINAQEGWASLLETDPADTDLQTGWVLHTRNGGATWDKHPFMPDRRFSAIRQIHFYSAEEGLINGVATDGDGGMEGLFKTSDGGATWTFFPPFPFPPQTPYLVHFPDPNRLLITGQNGLLMLSADRGENWRILPRPAIGDAIVDAAFVDDQTGWLLTSMGGVLKTTCGGYDVENELFIPLVVQDEHWQTVVEITNRDGSFHNYYIAGVNRNGQPLRDPARANLVQTGKTVWVHPHSTAILGLDELFGADYLPEVAALRIYTGEDLNLNTLSAVSVRYRPFDGGEDVLLAVPQTPARSRLFVERLIQSDSIVTAWEPYLIAANTSSAAMDIWLQAMGPEGPLALRVGENMPPYSQIQTSLRPKYFRCKTLA